MTRRFTLYTYDFKFLLKFENFSFVDRKSNLLYNDVKTVQIVCPRFNIFIEIINKGERANGIITAMER